MDDDLLSILDKAGLDEERCKKSKKASSNKNNTYQQVYTFNES